MSEEKKPLIIYHAGCYDGYTSACVAANALGGEDAVEMKPMQCGDGFENIVFKGRDVYVLDLSLSKMGTLEVAAMADQLVVLGRKRHTPRMQEITGDYNHFFNKCFYDDMLNMYVEFDKDRSVAEITCDYFDMVGDMDRFEKQELEKDLLQNLKDNRKELEVLLDKASQHWDYEDKIYRFYHQSYKVFGLQGLTNEIVEALQELMPELNLNDDFQDIVADGTGLEFEMGVNNKWTETVRPILEAFFHAKFMLEMGVKYAKELDEPPSCLPSGWAAFLYLYKLR